MTPARGRKLQDTDQTRHRSNAEEASDAIITGHAIDEDVPLLQQKAGEEQSPAVLSEKVFEDKERRQHLRSP